MPCTDNPLLDFSGLPRFDTLMPGDVQPAISHTARSSRALIERLTADDVAATWADFAAPLTDGFEQLSRAWGMVTHVHSVNDMPEWRDAYNSMLPEVSSFYAEVGQNLKLFAGTRRSPKRSEYAAVCRLPSAGRRQRDSRFSPQRCGVARRGQQAALSGDCRGTCTALGKVLGEPARRHQRLCRS
jgi:Zn-dependent oligopeptidase